MTLEAFFAEHPEAAVAFSGGVDSAYLLYAASRSAERVNAYYVKTSFQPYFELEDALRLTRELDVKLTVLCLDVLSDENVAQNPENRCYFCKRRIFGTIAARAAADGFSCVLDGTNASDAEDDRPGMRALNELSILSPLRICGLTKADIRRLSRGAGLFTWDKPSYSCLATRIPHGMRVTRPLLFRTEAAEAHMRGLGFTDFRVRTTDNGALIQVTEDQFPLLDELHDEVFRGLERLYGSVEADPKPRPAERI